MAWGGKDGQLSNLGGRPPERPIGSEAVLNSKPVQWAGEDYGWQSPESFKKLQDEEYFAPGEKFSRTALNVLKPASDTLSDVLNIAYRTANEISPQSALGQGMMAGTAEVASVVPDTITNLADKATPQGWVGPSSALLLGMIGEEALDRILPVGKLIPNSGVVKKAKRLKLTRTDEALAWIDEGNEFIRRTGSQRDWENKIFTDSDGNQWQLKSQGIGKDAKPRSMEAAARDKAGRELRENAWKAQLKEVLKQRGTYTPERYKELSKRITSQINRMKTHIRNVNRGKPKEEWISFGHKKSLKQGGINVPENVVFEPYLENLKTQHKLDPSDAAVRQSGAPLSIEEWVLQQEILEEFGDILPYRGLPNDLQIKILKTESQEARDALVEAYYLKNTKIE